MGFWFLGGRGMAFDHMKAEDCYAEALRLIAQERVALTGVTDRKFKPPNRSILPNPVITSARFGPIRSDQTTLFQAQHQIRTKSQRSSPQNITRLSVGTKRALMRQTARTYIEKFEISLSSSHSDRHHHRATVARFRSLLRHQSSPSVRPHHRHPTRVGRGLC